MSKLKYDFKFLVLVTVHFFVCLFLCIYALPDKIPTLIGFDEKIICLGSKWLMMLAATIPTILGILAISLKKHNVLSKLFKALFYLALYENMLLFIYFSLSKNIQVQEFIEIPLSTFIFIPLSFFIMLYGLKIKNVPYKSAYGIRFKSTQETQFIWTQSHIFARDAIFGLGFVLFICSVVLSFFHYWYITFAIFIIATILTYVIIWNYSRSIQKKYLEMKSRQEQLNNRTQENK